MFLVPHTTQENYLESWFEDGKYFYKSFFKKLNFCRFFAYNFYLRRLSDEQSPYPNSWGSSGQYDTNFDWGVNSVTQKCPIWG